MRRDLVEADGHDHEVQQQVSPDDEDRDADRLPKALQKDGAQHPQQQEGYADPLAVQEAWHERVLDDVHGGVRRGEGDRDYPGCGHEPQQAEHEQLALPEREQVLEHRDRALPVGALLGDHAVHRQHPEEGQEHYEKGGYGRERPGRDRRDGRYVAQGGEVIDASQAHHLPPRVLLLALPGLGPLYLLDALLEKPEL